MATRLRRFFAFNPYFAILSSIFLICLTTFISNNFIFYPFINFFQILSGIFITMVGMGMSTILIIQWLTKRNFDRWEFISFSFLGSMLFSPLILTLEYTLFKKAYNWYPLANALVLWIISGVILFFKKTSFPELFLKSDKIWKHPLFIVIVFGIIFTLFQVFAYPALPDLDPYKWLMKYSYQFSNQQLDYSERPFFGALTFAATQLTGLSIFTFYKYILPFYFLTISFPAWMVARTFADPKKKWIFLLFIFTSPVVLLYGQTAMPQSFFIFLSYYFIFFLLYSIIKRDNFFLYFSGIIMFLAIFYHQAAVIIFIIWALGAIYANRAKLIANKLLSLILSASAILSAFIFSSVSGFVTSWIGNIIDRIRMPNNLNLLYPSYYINTDRHMMGWGSALGVLKFYAFHSGPLVACLLFIFLILFFSNKNFRSFLVKKIREQASFLIPLTGFIMFFTIAEILPRFPNIALLPDRAWIFCGIFSFVFLYVIFRFFKTIPNWIFGLFLVLFFISLSGAIYINHLKLYLVTPEQWKSGKWIEKNLPKNRIFLSYGHKNLIPVHSDSALKIISPEIYCDQETKKFEDILLSINSSPVISPPSKPISLSAPLPIEYVYNQKASASIPSAEESSLYVYYARRHEKNLYSQRPYSMLTWGIEPCPGGKFLFDLYPEKFKRIYTAKDEEVIIWQVL